MISRYEEGNLSMNDILCRYNKVGKYNFQNKPRVRSNFKYLEGVI